MFLAVAAVHPEGWIDLGHEIRIGSGEVGFAAEVQRVMDRREFDGRSPTPGSACVRRRAPASSPTWWRRWSSTSSSWA